MRTTDAASSIFYSAHARDGRRVANLKIDARAVRDAALGALRQRRSRDEDAAVDHPGAHFVKAGVDFFHGDHPTNCEHAQLTYGGPSMSLQDAGETMTGLGYEMTGASGDGATYAHPDHEDGRVINLVAAAPSARDRRARDEGVGMDEGATAAESGGAGMSESASTLGGMSASSSFGGSSGSGVGESGDDGSTSQYQ